MVTTRSAAAGGSSNPSGAGSRLPSKKRPTKATQGDSNQPQKSASGLPAAPSNPSAPPSAPTAARRDVSPAASTGDEFAPPDLVVPAEAETAARNATTRTKDPRGFENPDNLACYRNAVVIMLLSSRRIMNWIEHRYIPALVAAGATIYTEVESELNRSRVSGDYIYTDVWCELQMLGHFYWTGRKSEIKKAMKGFWSHFTDATKYAGTQWALDRQQDATEFLGYLINLAMATKTHLCEDLEELAKRVNANADAGAIEKLKKITIDEMVAIFQTARIRCNMCGTLPGMPTMTRLSEVTKLNVWPLSFGDLSASAGKQGNGPIALTELLRNDHKSTQDGWLCNRCRPSIIDDTHKNRVIAAGNDAAKVAEAKKQNSDELEALEKNKTIIHRRLFMLPEVLILSLTRFRPVTRGTSTVLEKDETPVTLRKTLDLAPFLEHRDGFRPTGPTKYRLVAIINHLGEKDEGHYINEIYSDGRWFEINDMTVRRFSLEETLAGQADGWTPYVLLYERIIDEEDEPEEEVREREEADFDITSPEDATPGQMFVVVSTEFAGMKVNFPQFVLDDKLPTNRGTDSTTLALKKGSATALVSIRKQPGPAQNSVDSARGSGEKGGSNDSSARRTPPRKPPTASNQSKDGENPSNGAASAQNNNSKATSGNVKQPQSKGGQKRDHSATQPDGDDGPSQKKVRFGAGSAPRGNASKRGRGRGGRGAAQGSSKPRTTSTSPAAYGALLRRKRQAQKADRAFEALLQRFVAKENTNNNNGGRGQSLSVQGHASAPFVADEMVRTPKSHVHNARRSVTWATQHDLASPMEWDAESHTEEGSDYNDDGLDAFGAPSAHRTSDGIRVVEYRSLPAYVDSLMQMRRMNGEDASMDLVEDIAVATEIETEGETDGDIEEMEMETDTGSETEMETETESHTEGSVLSVAHPHRSGRRGVREHPKLKKAPWPKGLKGRYAVSQRGRE